MDQNVAHPKSLYLYDMTWPEVKAALPDIKVAIIPTGSTEQHGPHGTFEVDSARAREFAKRLAQRVYPHALVTPCVTFGISGHHMHFPGTISLRAETFIQVLMDIVWSLYQHGIRRFFFINGHGGNKPALTIVVNRIRQEMDAKAAWASPTSVADDVIKQRVKSPMIGHACESEMSQCLYLCHETVRTEYLTKGEIYDEALAKHLSAVPVEEGRFWEEITANGALGDASQANVELGQVAIETALDRLTAFLVNFMNS
ncbi:MAG: creatininase family protein [Candidatus Fermentithermobacillus carboniphilus]|uniref:Creatininase family protein n=1 Tax=Candidatus Fermentithermobacillus carboniphilus TaxID=3085328 RepID=A0AAT9LDF8_9FIRM|nr:MAG: creatininase family protein [Candidatus Fermentithermobacillus carboniphilus]